MSMGIAENKSGLRIAFLSSFDPMNKRAMSGVSYFFLKILKQHFKTVDIIGPAKTRKLLNGYLSRALRLLFRRKRYNLDHSLLMAYFYKREFKRLLKNKHYDCIFALRASTEIALLQTDAPLVYYSDATFSLLYNYYTWFSGFTGLSVAEGNKIEQKALNKSRLRLFASEWAMHSAIKDYGCKPETCFEMPFPANIEEAPLIEMIDKSAQSEVCNLLFLGVEWERKGGQIAYDAYLSLKARGVKCTLTICGCVPPETTDYTSDAEVTVIPYLNKNDEAQYSQFEQLMYNSHFLILPTRAECYGIVFAEASAFAVPSLATNTGGVGAVVKDGINGCKFPPEAGGRAYADFIEEHFADYESKYLPLSRNSRKFYDENLSPAAIGARLVQILEHTFLNKN